ncbi:MAG: methionine--tRNA ligase subunit beta [Candidatus Yanofskybacteria bacterium]|nr:methionine--tRNA ligase subunit beta [Candidatus Yanofskybacteria bacterium]
MSETITYDDFKKIDLRVAKILEAVRVDGSDKLVKLKIDVGDPPAGGGQRQLIAGIGTIYTPEILIGKQIVIVANLEPRKLMGYESQGMLLAASDELGPVLIAPESEVVSGTGIK